MKRKIASIFLIVVVVLGLGSAAVAAEISRQASKSALTLDSTQQGNQVSVDAYLTEEGVTNGRMVFTYDADQLKLLEVTPNEEGWLVSVDSSTSGQVAFAWADSALTEDKTAVVTLNFKTLSYDDYTTKIGVETTELYKDGEAAENPSNELKVNVSTENPYTDIAGHWYMNSVLDAHYAGLVNGMGNNLFEPELLVNRAMFTTMLYRMAGSPEVSGTVPFTDVDESRYYMDALVWAYKTGIVRGTTATTFEPFEDLTREQMVEMLYRYAGKPSVDTSAEELLGGFADADEMHTYAVDSMCWAISKNIIQGHKDGTLEPQGTATRAQAATVLSRFVD